MSKIFFHSLLLPIVLFGSVAYACEPDRLAGYILLQVESVGEAWYVHPSAHERYYLGHPDKAVEVFCDTAIGMTHEQVMQIPVAVADFYGGDFDNDGLPVRLEGYFETDLGDPDSDNDGYLDGIEVANGYDPLGTGRLPIDGSFTREYAGHFILTGDEFDERLWYVDPQSLKRYMIEYERDADDVIRAVAVGITNEDLTDIPVSEYEENPLGIPDDGLDIDPHCLL